MVVDTKKKSDCQISATDGHYLESIELKLGPSVVARIMRGTLTLCGIATGSVASRVIVLDLNLEKVARYYWIVQGPTDE